MKETEEIRILAAERDNGDGVIVTFSDGTMDGYVAEELLALRPYRQPISNQLAQKGASGEEFTAS
jgi:hypothetical protein